ncbi:Uncharacterised protein [Chlamydia abortus]|nr:Uncharacterised protein [Chlamydia abortus]
MSKNHLTQSPLVDSLSVHAGAYPSVSRVVRSHVLFLHPGSLSCGDRASRMTLVFVSWRRPLFSAFLSHAVYLSCSAASSVNVLS